MSETTMTLAEFLELFLVDIDLDWISDAPSENYGDLSVGTDGDLKLNVGLKVIENDIRARILTRRKTVIDGVTYPAETSEDNFGSSLPYVIGRKKTLNNVRLAQVYIAEALLDCPYILIDKIEAELHSSKDLNSEMVKINIKGTITFPVDGIEVQGLNEKIVVEVTY